MEKRIGESPVLQWVMIIFFILILFSFLAKFVKDREKDNRCEEDIKRILTAIDEKRRERNTVLVNITGDSCSPCSCWEYGLDDTTCIDTMTRTFVKLGFPGLFRDPWGNPYLIDENEWEDPENPCVHDAVYSENKCEGYVPFYICSE